MDRPDELQCYSCHSVETERGWHGYIWTCTSCGKISQQNKNGSPVQATKTVLALIEEFDQMERVYRQRLNQHKVPIQMGKGMTPRMFSPYQDGLDAPSLLVMFAFGTAGLVSLYLSFIKVGLGLIVLAIWLGRRIRTRNLKNAAKYAQIEMQWDQQKRAFSKKISDAINRA